MKDKIFVLGAKGYQGSAIAKELLNKNYEVVTLSRTIEETESDLTVLKGELSNKAILLKSMTNVKAAVYTFPLIFDEGIAETYTTNFIESAKKQNVPLIVWNTGFDLPSEKQGMISLDLKVKIKELFDASGLNVITLVPDIYLDNVSAPWSISVIQNNSIIPYPIDKGKKMPWISHVDLAKYVVAAIEKPELSGSVLPIGGNLVNGNEIAEAVSDVLGKKVEFLSITPDYFQEQLTGGFGELAAKEIANLYRYIDENYADLINKDYKKTEEILGVRPQSLASWAKSVHWS